MRERLNRWVKAGVLRGRWAGAAVAVVLVLVGAVAWAGSGSDENAETAANSGPNLDALIAGELGPKRSAAADPEELAQRRARAQLVKKAARKAVDPGAARGFWPLYREAERAFGVNRLLLASVHRQETAFSTAEGTYQGLNAFGCCAGPMQFNLTNGPPSTWKLYRDSYEEGERPPRYPSMRRSHPSPYDDFDAIMAAGALLRDSGAGGKLNADAWRAALAYYGYDLYGVTYANEVTARAVGWKRDGFCATCELDQALIERFERRLGADVRAEMGAPDERAEKRRKAKERRAERRAARKERQERREARADREQDDEKRNSGSKPKGDGRTSPGKPGSGKPGAKGDSSQGKDGGRGGSGGGNGSDPEQPSTDPSEPDPGAECGELDPLGCAQEGGTSGDGALAP